MRCVFNCRTDSYHSRAKVKCIHEGSPPCQRCQKNKNEDCVLTDPRVSRPGNPKPGASRKRRATTTHSPEKRLARGTDQEAPRGLSETDECLISSLPSSIVITAVETYRKKFPITNFLHYPSLISDISSNPQSVDPIFIASLLSLCVRFMNGGALEDAETYADYARKQLAHRVMEAPSLYLAQSLVMISFYEWGTGRPYQAWMYSGRYSDSYLLPTKQH